MRVSDTPATHPPAIHRDWYDAIVRRDGQFDGIFFFGVATTGVFCRPSCAARRPNSENVRYFASAADAERAGFRACKRCRPLSMGEDPQRDVVAQICRFLEAEHARTPTLDELAARFHLSPFHLQRSFKKIVGVSPRQYADAGRQRRLRDELAQGEPVTSAVYGAGYGSAGSFYRGADDALGMTPTSYRRGGADVAIRYTVVGCALGWLLLAATERGLCKVALGDDEATLVDELARELPAARRERADAELAPWAAPILAYLDGARPQIDLPLDIQATAFQRQVWQALRAIPYGSTRSYTEVALAIGRPTAQRAVARACATNPVALVIPCHRVVRESGELSGYRWGVARKRQILAREAAESETIEQLTIDD